MDRDMSIDAALVGVSLLKHARGREAFLKERDPGFHAVQEAGRFGTRTHAFLVPPEPLRPQIGLALRSRDPPLGPLHRPSHQSGRPIYPIVLPPAPPPTRPQEPLPDFRWSSPAGQLLSKGGFPLMVGTLTLVRELPAVRFVWNVCRGARLWPRRVAS